MYRIPDLTSAVLKLAATMQAEDLIFQSTIKFYKLFNYLLIVSSLPTGVIYSLYMYILLL